MPAVLPPPEEERDVETAMEAAQAKEEGKKAAGSNAKGSSAKKAAGSSR
jgi:hypothetical protein